jgi:hypothetical protein
MLNRKYFSLGRKGVRSAVVNFSQHGFPTEYPAQ